MFKYLSEKGVLLVGVLFIAFTAILISWLFDGYGLTLITVITLLIILALTGNAWVSTDSNYRIRRFMLSIISLAAIPNTPIVYEILRKALKGYIELPSNDAAPLVLLFLILSLIIVFYFTRDKSNFANTNQPINKLIEGPTIKQKWESVCRGLESQIRDIDRDTNWSNEYYTPLEAEVEVRTSNGTKKVVKDLLEAIKGSKDRLFLMIGDPGAGKSVALRKLCLDILKDSVKKEYIPIYVNLKEWVSTNDWHKTPPKWQDLESFVKESLLNKDRHLGDFFEKHYDVLDENGNLFFVLDSFDEIPQVLGTTAESKLIEDLTKVCREFLVGAKQPRSKGILASREYRMPRAEYLEANTTLRVRPFSEAKIETTLLQSGKVQKEIVERLFKERRDLIPILRNPFISSLLQSYLVNNKNKLPLNQSELYADYIDQSIEQAQKRLNLTHIPKLLVLDFAIQGAKLIFSESGLQAPINLLRSNIKIEQFDEIISILRYTRIARGNIIGADIFSFTHRRFYEYFVVCDLLTQEGLDLPLESIPKDSRWRDTLVLYCEVAPFEQAQKIANYCWEVIYKANNISERNSKHCLRFLTEAFKGRQNCLIKFYNHLAEFILEQIDSNNDPIDIKIAVEALGILNSSDIDKGAIKAFKIGDGWINDTALRSCRHLIAISEELKESIMTIIGFRINEKQDSDNGMLIQVLGFRIMNIKMNLKDIAFSFKLSEAFELFQKIIFWYKIEKPIKISLFVVLGLVFFNILSKYYSSKNMFDLVFESFLVSFFSMIMPIVIFESLYFDPPAKGTVDWKKIITGFINFLKNKVFWLLVILLFLYWMFKNKIKTFFEEITLSLNKMWWLQFIEKTLFSIIIGIFLIIGFLMFLYELFVMASAFAFYKKLNKSKLTSRKHIAEAYLKLKHNKYMASKLIAYLENNVQKATGAFPLGFLKAGQSSLMTRLIQLEERWREAEEREETLK